MSADLTTTHPCDWDTDKGCPVCGLTRETMALLQRTPLLDATPREVTMPSRSDSYQDADGNVWAFDPPYDEDEDFGYHPGEDE